MNKNVRDNPRKNLSVNLTNDPLEAGSSTDFPLTFGKVVELFYLDQQIGERSPKTLQFYRDYIRYFTELYPGIQNKPITEITDEHIQRYLLSKNDHVYAKSAAYRTLRALFYFALKKHYVERNIVAEIRAPKIPKDTTLPIINKQDFVKLLRSCGGSKFIGRRDKAILLVLYDTGLRLSELANMTFSELNLEKQEIRVIGKGNKRRTVSFDLMVKDALIAYLQLHPKRIDEIWLTEEKTPLHNAGIYRTIYRRAIACGFKRIHPHTFRHSCAVNLLQAGMDMDSVMKYLGQESITVLQGYLKSLKSLDASVLHRKFSPVKNLY